MVKPVSLRHAVSLLWLAIAWHVGSSCLALLDLFGAQAKYPWLSVDGMAIVALLIAIRGLNAGNRWARWLLVPCVFMIAALVFPRMLLSADPLVLWVALFQGVTQLGAAWFAFERDATPWFAGSRG